MEIANKVGGAEIVSRVVEDLKDENEQYRKMVMDCIEKVSAAWNASGLIFKRKPVLSELLFEIACLVRLYIRVLIPGCFVWRRVISKQMLNSSLPPTGHAVVGVCKHWNIISVVVRPGVYTGAMNITGSCGRVLDCVTVATPMKSTPSLLAL